MIYGHHALAFRLLAQPLAELADIALCSLGFRVLTPTGVRPRQLVAGAIAGCTFWTLLQALGAYLVHYCPRSDSV